MKKKVEQEKPKALEVGEMVLTPISAIPGEIKLITQKPSSPSLWSPASYTVYTVALKIPYLNRPYFHEVEAEFGAGELKRVTD